MPVKLDNPAVLCTGNHLLVTDIMKNIIYVMDTTSLKWFFAGKLPLHGSLSVCGTELYVLSYYGSVFSCSLPTLLQSPSVVRPETTEVWQKLASIPVEYSTVTTLCGQLAAVGGRNILSKCIDTIHLYNPLMDSWNIIGHMPTARSSCLVATLPDDTLVVIGGYTRKGHNNVVEVAYRISV